MKYDKEDMIGILESFSEQCKEAVRLAKDVKAKGKFENICVCGMGGSGVGGALLKPFVKNIPLYVHHDYGLPEYVGKKSLVFIVSYSGDTEETLSSYDIAKKRRARIISITSGGKLAAKDKNAIIIPSGLQPREALGYLFLPMIVVLSNSKLISNQKGAINEAIKLLNPKENTKEAFMLSKKMKNRIPVFYGSEHFEAVVYRMKTQVNENSKQAAFCHTLPEMNHNEINGFKHEGKRLVAVFLRDKKDSMKIKKRIIITRSLIKENTTLFDLTVKGNSLLARILSTIYIGDLASYYLALMNKEDPTPVPLIKELKKKLVE
jgi:glucose/mannose-6-phosphate isomerase